MGRAQSVYPQISQNNKEKPDSREANLICCHGHRSAPTHNTVSSFLWKQALAKHEEKQLMGVLGRVLFRESLKSQHLQKAWSRLHNWSLFGMNYGGGGLIDRSGEKWVLSHVVAPACKSLKAPIVFDVGANVGDYSLCVRRHLPAAQIYAFEPSRTTHEQLVQRISAEGADKTIAAYNLGFSDSDKMIDLYSYSIDGCETSILSSIELRRATQHARIEPSFAEKITVETIDGFCKTRGISTIDFLKIDVEGHELSVLRGASQMLASSSISMIQFEFGPGNIYSRTYFYDFWSLLSEEYNIHRIIPRGIVPVAHYEEQLEVFLCSNYLAVRRS
jgi:FkbM family methyltransferase